MAEVAIAAAGALTLDVVVRSAAGGFVRAGLEPGRVSLAVRTVHPALAGIGFAWSRTAPHVATHTRPWGFLDQREHLEGSLRAVMSARAPLRLRVASGEGLDALPIVRDFRDQGAIDDVAVPVSTIRGDTHVLSVQTDRPGRWDDAEVATVCALAPVLALAIESFEWRRLSQTILETYLGRRTGPKVLAGRIHRGERERIRAAVSFCDVRSFTDFTRRYGDEATVAAMNGWFDIVVDAVHRHDGEVLKFMGDAFLSIFPVRGDDWATAVESALVAAVELHTAERARRSDEHADLKRRGPPHGRGHLRKRRGAGRLDFTVIGTAVNTASRIAALCRPLEKTTVFSRRVAETSSRDFRSCGSHVLRGLVEPMEVFAPSDGPTFAASIP